MAKTKPCEHCGTLMSRKKPNGVRIASWKWKKKRFCGNDCWYAASGRTPRHEHSCAHCGAQTMNPKYCSKRCMGDAWTKPDRPIEVIEHRGRQKARRTVSLTECYACGTSDDLQRHHIDLDPTNNAPDNIAILCRTCHSAHHAAIRRGTQLINFGKSTSA